MRAPLALRTFLATTLSVLFITLTLVAPTTALAHPLGNFTVNRYARLELSPERVRIRYVLDLAEIPTFQALPQLDADGNGTVTDAEKARFAERQLAEAVRNLHLDVDGRRISLRPSGAEAELLAGQAGLQTLRLTGWADAPGAAIRDGASVSLRDENEPGKIGWREIVVRAQGVSPAGLAPALTRDLSNELRTYPEDLLSLPPDVRTISFVAQSAAGAGSAPGGMADGTQPAGTATSTRHGLPSAAGSLDRARDGLTDLISAATLTPAVIALALLTAFVLGGMHALSPGHGKTIVGAYLAGSRGTAKHALFLGLTVTVVHTAGVFALLLVTLFASRYVVPEQLFPWMSLASGLLVVWIGVGLVRARWPWRAGSVAHGHDHDGSAPHSHGFGTHTHALPGADGAPLTWRGLLALGISGGLLPCPSALVLGLGAIALNRALYGLVLIVFFSAGLAATLTAIGLVMVYSGRAAGRLRLLERLGGAAGGRVRAVVRVLPVASAGVVALAGLALSFDALRQLDAPELWQMTTGMWAEAGHAVQAGQAGTLALLVTALTLGLRHGIDWDHLAAITDITGTTSPHRALSSPVGADPRVRPSSSPVPAGSVASPIRPEAVKGSAPALPPTLGGAAALAMVVPAPLVLGVNWNAVGLASLYAGGHGLVVLLLGLAALRFGAILPTWVDPLMERAVGATLVFLGAWVAYSLVRYWRGGGEFRLQSRWMLVFSGLRRLRAAVEERITGHTHAAGAPHAHRLDQYGPGTAFGTGLIHGIGAETGTQVLIIAAVGYTGTEGAASQGLGVAMLLAFVAGLLLSNTAVAVLTSAGFLSSVRVRWLYLAAGVLAAVFSLWVGSYALLGMSDQLPDLQVPISALFGEPAA